MQIDQELSALEIELTNIRLVCGAWVIQIGCSFTIREGVEDAVWIDPWERVGDLRKLWSLIDIKCTYVSMTLDRLAIHFSNGATIEVTNTRDVPELVNIWHPGDEVIVMTRYPTDLMLP